MQVQCKLCNHFVDIEEFERHYKRCSSIKYIQKMMKEFYNQDIKYSDLYSLSDIEFDKKYLWILNRIYDKSKDRKEINRLENILYGASYGLKDCL